MKKGRLTYYLLCPPSKYYAGPTMLNFRDLTRTGVFIAMLNFRDLTRTGVFIVVWRYPLELVFYGNLFAR